MTLHRVTAYLNQDPQRLAGYVPGAPLDELGTFEMNEPDHLHAAKHLWVVGNAMGSDIHGAIWPNDARAFHVGDVVRIWSEDYTVARRPVWLAAVEIERRVIGWQAIADPLTEGSANGITDRSGS